MARKGSVPPRVAIETIKKFADYFKTDPLPAWSHNVWKNMSKALDGKWSFETCYLNVFYDRNSILSEARMELGVAVPPKFDENNNSSMEESIISNSKFDGDASFDASFKLVENETQLDTFDLVLTEQQWNAIVIKEDNKIKLKPGMWTNEIALSFWQQFRLPCAFVFKRAEVRLSPNGTTHIKIIGSCKSKSCNNTFRGEAEKEDGIEGLTVRIKTRDTRGEDHEKSKRPLNGERRKEVQKEVKAEGCSIWRKRQARENMRPGETEPPVLPSGNVCRQARKEGVETELGVEKEDGRDLIRTIEEMALNPEYAGLIHDVGSLPFHVLYSSPAQLYAYKEFCRVNKSPIICLDSTGSLVTKLNRKGRKSGHIFLYSIVINFDGTTIAVHQMLSEKHTTEFIELWLRQWVRSGAPKPNQAVCDYSRALLCAISLAFNNETIKSYISTMFSAISSGGGTKRPNTLIRVDVAHLIHAVCRWSCWKAVRQACIKEFFVRCIAMMVECIEFVDFQEIFYLTCVVGLQTHQDSAIIHSELRTVQEARKKLEACIAVRGINIETDAKSFRSEDERKHLEAEYSSEPDKSDKNRSCIDEWVDGQIASAGKILRKGQELNPFYLTEFVKLLSILVQQFPLWTSVGMVHGTPHATSSYVEGYFNDIKTRVLKHTARPMRVDKFLKAHARDIAGATLLFSSNLINFNAERCAASIEPKSNVDISCSELPSGVLHPAVTQLNDSDLLSTENWRRKAETDHMGDIDSFDLIVEDMSSFPELSSNAYATLVQGLTLPDSENLQDDFDIFENSANTPASVTKFNTADENNESSDVSMIDHSYCATSKADVSDIGTLNLKSTGCTEFKHSSTRLTVPHSSSISIPSKIELNLDEQQRHQCNQDSKKPSKYFRVYPEIRYRNNLVGQKKKSTLLPHGSRCPPVKMIGKWSEKKAYYLTNTCAFDSLVHILMTVGIDDVNYFDFLEKSQNLTLRLVHNLIEKGATQTLFRERVIILKGLFSCIPHTQTKVRIVSYLIDATDSIANIANKTLSSEPSVANTENCSICEGRTYGTTVLSPNHKNLADKGFSYLEKALHFRSPILRVRCRDPCLGQYTWLREPRNHIIIELDVRPYITCTTGMTCALRQMPATLTFQHGENIRSVYRLVGIVAYVPGHYVAYCLRSSGVWQIYDDLAKGIATCSSRTEVNPHLVVYIRC